MRRWRSRSESGQALLLLLGVVAALLVGALALGALGRAFGAKGRSQRAADLAAISAARTMRVLYPRVFEAPVLEGGIPNPHYVSPIQYRLRAQRTAIRAALRNGVRLRPWDVSFPAASRGGSAVGRFAALASAAYAPTRVRVTVHGGTRVRVGPGEPGRPIRVRSRATAEITPSLGASFDQPAVAHGGGYDGPLAYRMGKPMRPDVALAFDRMAAAARREAGLYLSITSAFRSDAEQARLFAANPNPKWVAPPGTSLHRYGTELDLGPPAAYGWLATNAKRFGFIKRYAWEPWHFGYGANPRDRAHPAKYERGSWEPPGGDHGRIHHHLPSFVPPRFHDPIARAALRWNVPMDLLSAQLYAESGFNPFAASPAGARGIAQFMPGTARSYGLEDPLDPVASIDAQAHLMSDLLRRFSGRASLALAAYNAGAAAVERAGGIPPYSETQAYVSRILGLLGGAGALPVPTFGVHLVE